MENDDKRDDEDADTAALGLPDRPGMGSPVIDNGENAEYSTMTDVLSAEVVQKIQLPSGKRYYVPLVFANF